MQPGRVEPLGQGEAVVAEVGAIQVEAELPRVVPGAEEAGILARPGQRALHQSGRQGHAVRDAVAPAAEPVEHGRVAGEVVARRDPIEIARPARIGRLARQHAVDRDQVVPLGMGHRSDDRQPPCPRRQARQVLAHADSRYRRVDRLELAPDAVRRLGLHVERVVLSEPAAEQDHDHRARPPRVRARRCRRSRREQSGKPDPHEPRVAHVEEGSP